MYIMYIVIQDLPFWKSLEILKLDILDWANLLLESRGDREIGQGRGKIAITSHDHAEDMSVVVIRYLP